MKFMKTFIKKIIQKISWVNPLSTILISWDQNNLIKSKSKQIMKLNSQFNTILNDKIRKNSILKKISQLS
jgi:predicted P-loop ATPase/GTPase